MRRGAISVTDGTSDRDLVELATLKDDLGVSGSSLNSKLERLIAMFGSAVTDYLGREPWHQGYEEKGPSQGGLFLRLQSWPIDRVSSVVDADGDTITATDYEISGMRRDRLYREDGWTCPTDHGGQHGDRDLDYTSTYYAGWLMPGQVINWKATRAFAIGEWARSTDTSVGLRFEATTGGTTDSSEPTWPTAAGDTVVDGTVTWTAREAEELPYIIEEIGLVQIRDWFRGGLALPSGIAEKRTADVTTKYDVEATRVGFHLLPATKSILRRYR